MGYRIKQLFTLIGRLTLAGLCAIRPFSCNQSLKMSQTWTKHVVQNKRERLQLQEVFLCAASLRT